MKKIPPHNPVDWQMFGRFIFTKREADPGYYVINYLREAGYAEDQLKRFAVAWCAFYNLGIAARASELKGDAFYRLLNEVYPTAKRASERRHFRGNAGMFAINAWQAGWPRPEKLAEFIMADDMGAIRKACDKVPQMGDYFKWKWGDLTEVLTQEPVNFRGWENKSPKVPQQGAALIAAEAGKEDWDTERVYLAITKQMRKLGVKSAYAPWREFDVQDAETICCVYKQYRSGGYTPGLRTAKAAARLHHDGAGCKTAKDALHLLLTHQPQPEFSDPATLNSILTGETIFDVRELL
jgi:hypothetical protein